VKFASWLITLLLTGLLCLSGAACKKKVVEGPPKTPQEAAYQFRLTIGTASAQIIRTFNEQVDPAVHYEKYQEALVAMGPITNDPSLNPEQRKLANQLVEMLAAKVPNP
jgi:hypothetical protein